MLHFSSVPKNPVCQTPYSSTIRLLIIKGITVTEHLTRIIYHKIDRVRNGLLPEITEKDSLDQRNILSSVLLPELEDAPFTMDHGDLATQNIIIDAEHNVTG
jgi:hypothetical protein